MIRDNIFRKLGVAIPPGNRFCVGRVRKPGDSPFMVHRQPAYRGWRDRMSGMHYMKHNRIDYTADGGGDAGVPQ